MNAVEFLDNDAGSNFVNNTGSTLQDSDPSDDHPDTTSTD